MPTNLTSVGCPRADPAPAVGVQDEPAPGQARRPVDVVVPASSRPPARGSPTPSPRSAGSPDAPALLGVSPGLLDEVARNLVLDTAPATPAAEVYTGVLYDALGLATLDTAARRRANRWLVVVSALHGAVRPSDRITAYRLSMGATLPGLGPLAAVWRPALDEVLPGRRRAGVVVDCRSASYAAAWRPGADLARALGAGAGAGREPHGQAHPWAGRPAPVRGRRDPRSVPALAEVVSGAFDVRLHEPTSARAPWVMDVTPP